MSLLLQFTDSASCVKRDYLVFASWSAWRQSATVWNVRGVSLRFNKWQKAVDCDQIITFKSSIRSKMHIIVLFSRSAILVLILDHWQYFSSWFAICFYCKIIDNAFFFYSKMIYVINGIVQCSKQHLPLFRTADNSFLPHSLFHFFFFTLK